MTTRVTPHYAVVSYMIPIQPDVPLPPHDDIVEMNAACLIQVFEGLPSDALGLNLVVAMRKALNK